MDQAPISASNKPNLRDPALAATVAVVLVTVITILGELYAPLKNWLKSTFYHHWLGKGYLATGSFLLVWLLLAKSKGRGDAAAVRVLALTGIACTLILLLFFWYEYIH